MVNTQAQVCQHPEKPGKKTAARKLENDLRTKAAWHNPSLVLFTLRLRAHAGSERSRRRKETQEGGRAAAEEEEGEARR